MGIADKYYPWAKRLPKKFAVGAATLFGLGKLAAPGTWGAAAGALVYYLAFARLNFAAYAIAALALAYFAVGVCDAAERHLGLRDPGMINLDEFAAMPICYINAFGGAYSVWGIIAGFALFRFFDIKKPLVIYKLQSLEGGLGCVADDVAAALATALCLNAAAPFLDFLTL